HASKSPRVKKIFSPRRHMSLADCACLLLFAALLLLGGLHGALNVAITADYWERRLDDGASSPLITHVFDVAGQSTDDFSLVDIVVRDHDFRKPIFDVDH